MKRRTRIWALVAILAICGATLGGCLLLSERSNDDNPSIEQTEIIPNAPDYNDATPATLYDTITVSVSPQYHVLVVSGYDGSEYPAYRDFLNVGDIHSCEPWLYSECLAKNIAARTRAWREK